MVSHVAAIINLLNAQFSSPDMLGISPVPLPSNAPELYVTVQEQRAKELESLTGPSDIARSMIHVNVWDTSYEAADGLRTAIKDYLLGFTGDVVIASVTEAIVMSVNHNGDRELFDGNSKRHQLIAIFSIWWNRPV